MSNTTKCRRGARKVVIPKNLSLVSYVRRVMRTVENNHGISTKGAETVAAMTMEIFEKIANTAHQLAYSSGKKTLTDVELEAAARICLPPGMFKATNSWANQKVNAATK